MEENCFICDCQESDEAKLAELAKRIVASHNLEIGDQDNSLDDDEDDDDEDDDDEDYDDEDYDDYDEDDYEDDYDDAEDEKALEDLWQSGAIETEEE